MLYLTSGDKSTLPYMSRLNQQPEVVDAYLRHYFSGKFKVMDILEEIFTADITKKRYDMYMTTLTLCDMMPMPMTFEEVMPYFFALQVNYHNTIGETDGRIESRYLAGRIGNTCHWNFREYSGYNTLQNFEIEYVKFKVDFKAVLNTFWFEIPIVRVKKGLFNTKFLQKEVGYMINPAMESPGYFMIESGYGLNKAKLPKSLYMALFNGQYFNNNSYILTSKDNLSDYVDKNHTALILEMLYETNYFAVANFSTDGIDYWLDEDANLNIACRWCPKIEPENNTEAYFQHIRDNFYRLIYKHKFYVSYIYGSNIYIMCNR